MLDLGLAILHHLAVFTLVGVFAMEFVLLRPGLEGRRIAQLGRIDAAYGAAAGVVIVVGILRVIFGAAGWEHYAGNLVFWAKMLAFAAMGAISIPGTITIARWRRAAAADAGFVPPAGDVARARRMLWVQVAFFVFIPSFAAAMARGYGA